MANPKIDETGKRYGSYTVIGPAENTTKSTAAYWLARCDCGNTIKISGNDLRRNKFGLCPECKKKSKFYRVSDTELYKKWCWMRARCKYKSCEKTWRDYGGRGITVCDEWQSFEPFYEWATNNGYEPGLSIERIDVNKGYSPENCKWIPMSEQPLNTRNSETIVYEGKRMNLCQYADLIGVSRFTVYARRNRGWTDWEILNVPYGKHGKKRMYMDYEKVQTDKQ